MHFIPRETEARCPLNLTIMVTARLKIIQIIRCSPELVIGISSELIACLTMKTVLALWIHVDLHIIVQISF